MGGEMARQLQNSDLGYVIGAYIAIVVFFYYKNPTKHLISFSRWLIQMVKTASKKKVRKSEHMKKQLQHEKNKS